MPATSSAHLRVTLVRPRHRAHPDQLVIPWDAPAGYWTLHRPHTQPKPRKPRPPRLDGDPDRHIRVVKGGRYQARPYDKGQRYNLGCFHTKAQARKAILEFWWGRRPDLPRFVRKIRAKAGDFYLACVPVGDQCVRVGGEHPTAEAAARAAEAFVRQTFGERAEAVLRRR